MKKVIIFSFFILSSVMMTSCTTDSVADAAAPSQNVHADNETGGQTGPTNPPRP
ncbi:hypothetical protein [Flavobacterium sp. XGLA_31]|uniref:hypothetical protein n=1 Tax=Flavobacterium sp. XGLA_31 TaxID=3447666 RepID=UPI003F3863D0